MRFHITWFLLLLTYPCTCQTNALGFHHYYGQIFRDSRQMTHLIKGFPNMYELQWKTERTGRKLWEKSYNYPFTDIGFLITDFANKEELGYAISILPQIQILFNKKSIFTPFLTAGSGLSYHTTKYHPEENPANVTIGSEVNIVFHGYLGMQFRLSKKFLMDLGYGATHFSNGNLKEPNTGLNLILLKAGINYRFVNDEIHNKFSDTMLQNTRKYFWSVTLNQSVKRLPAAGNKFFYIAGSSGNFNFPVTKLGYIIFGIDFFVDYAVKYIIMNESEISYKKPTQMVRSGVITGYIFKFDKFEIPAQFGYYLYLPFRNVTSTYQRAGIQYVFTRNITAGLFLKTHYGHADYLEWTMGWRF